MLFILKNDTKLVLYYLNSETDFAVEEHELSERLDVGFIKNEDGNIYYRYPNGEYATGVTNIEGEEYYFAADGCMKIGYRKIGNKRYYFDPESGKSTIGVYNTGSYVFDFQGKGEVAKGLNRSRWRVVLFSSTGRKCDERLTSNKWEKVLFLMRRVTKQSKDL